MNRIKKAGIAPSFLTKEKEEQLWHILYSISDKQEIDKALKIIRCTKWIGRIFASEFTKMPPFESDYAAYSLKAIKKLLPFMRMGVFGAKDKL